MKEIISSQFSFSNTFRLISDFIRQAHLPNNHVIDALRYANEGFRRAEEPAEIIHLEFESEWG